MNTATHPIRADFKDNHLLHFLMAWYALVWTVTAIRPIDPRDWLMENVVVFAVMGLLVATYRVFPLSDVSYLLLTGFLTVHAIGAHYTYSRVPFGFWLQETFQFSRNHFDRIAHFAFGFAVAYPFREVFLRLGRPRDGWAYFLPIDLVLAIAALFEIFESWVVRRVDPALGEAYLGSQGDIWDAQKDMTASLEGAILCMVVTGILRRRLRKRAVAVMEYVGAGHARHVRTR